MRGRVRLLILACVWGLLGTWPAGADGQPHVQVIKVRTDCGSLAEPLCFEEPNALEQALVEIHEEVSPNHDHRLLVDIGPGTFALDPDWFDTNEKPFYAYCEGASAEDPMGYVTYRGAGQTQTTLRIESGENGYAGPPAFEGGTYAVKLENCDRVWFQDLKIQAFDEGTTTVGSFAGTQSGVFFVGDGRSYWRNVTIQVSGIPWWDGDSSSVEDSQHYWYDSTLQSDYTNACASFVSSVVYGQQSSHWFYGSTLIVNEADAMNGPSCGGASLTPLGLVYASGGYHIVANDTVFENRPFDSGSLKSYGLFLGQVSGTCGEAGSVIEGRGNTIRIRSPIGNGEIVEEAIGVRACGGRIDLQDTTYDLAATEDTYRIQSAGGTYDFVPQDLGSGTEPPDIDISLPWAELFVETDCSSSACDDTSLGDDFHVLTYDASCTDSGPWYDTTADACRGN